MKKTGFFTTIIALMCFSAMGQRPVDMNIDFLLRGRIYAKSSIIDSTALGGFGGSDNTPKVYSGYLPVDKDELFLYIDTSNLIVIDEKYNGYKLFIVNNSGYLVEFSASDSRLSAASGSR